MLTAPILRATLVAMSTTATTLEPIVPRPLRAPHAAELRAWLAEFGAARERPLEIRMTYAFVRTYKPVLDDAPYRSFDSMAEYRQWCETYLPSWLGYGRF